MYNKSAYCGACIKGWGSGEGLGRDPIKGPFKAYVVDQCKDCGHDDLDFFYPTQKDGRWEIEWSFYPCPAVPQPKFKFLFEGSNQDYWKIQPRFTATPVKELKVSGNLASRTDDNFFEVDGYTFDGEQQVETTTIKGVTETTGVSRPLSCKREYYETCVV